MDVVGLEQQEVLELEVPVHDLVLVAVGDGLRHLCEDQHRLVLRHRILLDKIVQQLPALTLFQHQVDAQLVLEGLIEPDNVGVVQLLHDLDFVDQPALV